jgi:hypothetical protein
MLYPPAPLTLCQRSVIEDDVLLHFPHFAFPGLAAADASDPAYKKATAIAKTTAIMMLPFLFLILISFLSMIFSTPEYI